MLSISLLFISAKQASSFEQTLVGCLETFINVLNRI